MVTTVSKTIKRLQKHESKIHQYHITHITNPNLEIITVYKLNLSNSSQNHVYNAEPISPQSFSYLTSHPRSSQHITALFV